MTGPRSFDRNELGTERPDELDDALTAAAWLDDAVDVAHVAPSAGFGDRVMAALANEPAPSPVGFLGPVRRRGYLTGFIASFRQAWASVGGGGRPVLARASALAYVLAIVIAGTSLAGVATVGIAGALGILGPTATQSAPPTPEPTRAPDSSLPSAESAPPPPTASESEEPSETPDASDDHGGGVGAEPSDDHGGGSGPGETGDDHGDNSGPGSSGSGSDDSESGSGSEGGTPRPSETPRPTGTPKPSETPD